MGGIRLQPALVSHSHVESNRNHYRNQHDQHCQHANADRQTTETVMNSTNTRSNHSRRALKTIGAFAALLVGAGAAGSALAASPANAATLTVAYGDLNLASDQGNSALYARITAAARQVCAADRVDIRDLGRYAEARSCEARAIAQAVQAVHSPRLAALYNARSPRG
jgi:UrcA family protein